MPGRSTEPPVILWGAPQSLFTGRARSYFIKQGIVYKERLIAEPHFRDTVVPKAGGRMSMPTVELHDGTVIRDSVAIVDHFEAQLGHTAKPPGPRQQLVSLLFDVIGAEGLLRPAMHYRWNFDDTQREFLRFHFRTIIPGNRIEDADRQMQHIRTRVNPEWGLTETAIPLIEELYLGFLSRFDALLAKQPYLLGGLPSVGDFGLIAPLYGHLGRDPIPRTLMQTYAVRVFRWMERMNSPEPGTSEYPNYPHQFLCNDEIPDELVNLLQHIATDFMPETIAAQAAINRWLASHDVRSQSECRRYAGNAIFEVEGVTLRTKAQPFRFYLLQRLQHWFDSMQTADQESARALLIKCGMIQLLQLRLDRGIGRRNNLEVWLD